MLVDTARQYLLEHVNTIIVSSAVFVLFSLINAAMTSKAKPRKEKSEPQPKWRVLNAMNYIVMGLFIGALAYGYGVYKRSNVPMANQRALQQEFLPVVVVLFLCLSYFFGFFGLSFVTDSLPSSQSEVELSKLVEEEEEAVATKNGAKRTSSKPIRGGNEVILPDPPGATTIVPSRLSPAVTADVPPICSDTNSPARPPATIQTTKTAYDDITGVDFATATDEEILELLVSGALKDYQLEKKLVNDYTRAVKLRRLLYEQLLEKKMDLIPFEHFDYGKIFGANCEIVIGYVPIPLGVCGPLLLNGQNLYIPMATTEGCLVASTNRGCKAISAAGGASSVLLKDAITRAPCLRFSTAVRAAECKKWVSDPDNYLRLEEAFNSTTSFGKLVSIDTTIAGRNAYLRFCCMSGDAMGMNMVSKGCLKAIEVLESVFPDLILVAISGNVCCDKKPAAINWILGRGKSVIVEAIIPDFIVKSVLKSSVKDMIDTNKQKNLIGSAMAGSVGGFNAHAANIVTAVFLATGQDPAQNVESSNCITLMDYAEDGESLQVSVTMPSIEVGTVGGGTHLPAQAGCLDICGVRGAAKAANSAPGDNSRKLAQLVGGAVLAGELSLMAALAANHLVRSHMQHNRKPQTSAEGAAAEAAAASASASASAADASASVRRNNSMPDLTAFKSSSLNPDVAPSRSAIHDKVKAATEKKK